LQEAKKSGSSSTKQSSRNYFNEPTSAGMSPGAAAKSRRATAGRKSLQQAKNSRSSSTKTAVSACRRRRAGFAGQPIRLGSLGFDVDDAAAFGAEEFRDLPELFTGFSDLREE
jgi:hypothetical protein